MWWNIFILIFKFLLIFKFINTLKFLINLTSCSTIFKDIANISSKIILSNYDKHNNLNIKTSSISMWFERWFLSSNAKDIGVLYLIYALFAGLVGTAFSVLIRLELSGPGVQYIADNQLYNSIITAHAIIMIFFMVMPALIGGFGNFLLPLGLGGPDMAFPRLNNISFLSLIPSIVLFLFAGGIENGVGTGWTLYPPLSGIQSHSGPSVDLAIFGLHLSGLSSLLGAMNFITTTFNMRSPGIRLHKLILFAWAVVITAVLLLLSLPVLAGKLNLPELNLAIFWEPLYENISQSAGNLESLNSLENLRGYTPNYFGCSLEIFIFPLFTKTLRCIHTDNKNILNKSLFSYYLTGLIEGDGTIITPKTLRSPKGKLNYPSIQIVFHLKDLPLGLLIQKELAVGSLSRKKGVNAYILTINSYEGIFLIISLINGNMRTPKIYSLNALIDFLNKTKGTSIEKHSVSMEPIDNNPWLSGFIEADASFQVRTTLSGKYPKLECKLEISQRLEYHKGYDNLAFLSNIAEFLETEVKKIRSDKPKPEYRVRTTNIKGNIKAKNYFLQFPLFGTKYLDSLDWIEIVDMFDRKEHKTDEGKEKIVKIKSGMNNFRTDFTWNHLQKFYNVKI